MSEILHKSFDSEVRKETPGTTDLEMISKFALEPMTAEDVFVFRQRLCNDQLDRSYEKFTVPILQRFADTIVGKGLLTGHDYSQVPVGRYFDAEVMRDAAGAHHVLARAFMRADDPLVAKVKAGIAKDVSIGFRADKRLCDLCDGKSYDGWTENETDPCPHVAGMDYSGKTCTVTYGGELSKYEAVEGSLVYLGCQRGAEVIGAIAPSHAAKAAHFDTGTKEHSMPPDQDTQGKASALGADREKELLLEIDALKKAQAENELLVADGKAYREFLSAEIKRQYAACDMEPTGITIAKSLEKATAEDLKAAEADARKLLNQKLGPSAHGIPAAPQHDLTSLPPRQFDPLAGSPYARKAV